MTEEGASIKSFTEKLAANDPHALLESESSEPLYDARSHDYKAAKISRTGPMLEYQFLLWHWAKGLECVGIPYPLYSLRRSDGDSYITLSYDKKLYTLRGHHLYRVLIWLREGRVQHLIQHSQLFHDQTSEELAALSEPCIERVEIENE